MHAPTRFSDGYPVLVISAASLADLNEKLVAYGRDVLPMTRFRPNIVLGGAGPFDEDYAESIRLGDAIIKPVKPYPHCVIPSTDPATGLFGADPLDILRTYRINPKVDDGITFGMNAIVLEGAGQPLHVGQEAEIKLAF